MVLRRGARPDARSDISHATHSIRGRVEASLYVRNLSVEESDFKVLVNPNFLGAKVNDFVWLAEGGLHLLRGLALLNARWLCRSRRWRGRRGGLGLALRLLAQHGDDAIPVVTRAAALKAVAHYGDDAARALLKHGQIGETLVERLGKEGVEALAKVTPRNGRRLAMMAAKDGLKPELLSVVTRYGDEACDFVWRGTL